MQYRNSLDKKFAPYQLQQYHHRHERNHRAVAVIWGIMTIMFAILNVMAFAQPHWIGDTNDSPGFGHLGVYQVCTPDYNTGSYFCTGSFTEFSSILTDAFRATTVFCGLSALLMLLCVLILLLFFCFKTGKVFMLCGVLETAAGRLTHNTNDNIHVMWSTGNRGR
ncbi:hypothetical protein FSP39_014665 [Pinctada imbricata]|uniref:Uncharacterized protein n=1 Tax=Pinctada imbricata TaxID=66713 RepID=A0AA88YDR2_PINIB|nr:hypothetical protein FSP39_014665 [Pinctada imbricata]